MSEMVERMARTLCQLDCGQAWEQYEAGARAAIEVMREPTSDMVNDPMARCYNIGPYGDKEVRRIYQAMIDKALGA